MLKKKLFGNRTILVSISLVAFLFFGCFQFILAEETEDINEEGDTECSYEDAYWDIEDATTWEKGVHIINKTVFVSEGATLTIEPGARIEFADNCMGEGAYLSVSGGRVIANGTKEDPIYISHQGDYYGNLIYFGNNFYDEEGKVSAPESVLNYVRISKGGAVPYVGGCTDGNCQVFQNIFQSLINTAYATDYGYPALYFRGGKLQMENCQFSNNAGMDIEVDLRVDRENQDDYLKIKNSNFENNISDIAVFSDIYGSKIASNPNLQNMLVLENNWYGSPDGPKFSLNSEELGEQLIGAVSISGFSSTRWALFPNETSNVLFLPGIKASYLYKEGFLGDDQLWPPTYFGNDIVELALDENGESLESVYAKGIIRELPVTGGNIYESFARKLEDLKEARNINDYNLYAYDWRRNVEDIASDESLTAEIERLATNSQNNKVTIVAHSNGGLLAKAITQRLEDMGNESIIDKLVFVGTPQMGAPRSILSLLYGYDEELAFGSLMNRQEARKLGENMPGAYGLLPSKEYLDRLEEPLVDFSSIDMSHETRYKTFKDVYGEGIENGEFEKFQDFLAGKIDGREKPSEDKIELENVLRENLLGQAFDTHENLDSWTPPENIKVIQIAGWGLDTISGVKYTQKEKMDCYPVAGKLPSCTASGEYKPVYEPIWTVDGDEIVTAPSALMIPRKTNSVEKYWVDLWSYDDILTAKRNHGDIFEVSDLQEFLENIIKNIYQNEELPENIKNHYPEPEGYDNAKPRIRMSLYSPLDIHLYDENEKHTGPSEIIDENNNKGIIFEENIPNSYYQQFGERKYVGFPGGEKIRVEMEGYDDGAYTLKLEEVALAENEEETILHTITFSNLPVSKDTDVVLEITENGLADLPKLTADFDGDEEFDYVVTPILDDEATLNVDEILPGINIVSPESKTYPGDLNLEISYSVSDNLSKPENIQTEIYLDGEKKSENRIDLSKFVPGKHKLKIIAIDEANNKSEHEVEFSIGMNIFILENNIEKYYQEGLIKNKAEKNKLIAGIHLIQREMMLMEMVKASPLINKKVKKILLSAIEQEIEKQINTMLKKINQDKKNYDLVTKKIIIEDLNWIKNNL